MSVIKQKRFFDKEKVEKINSDAYSLNGKFKLESHFDNSVVRAVPELLLDIKSESVVQTGALAAFVHC